jgi:hypothetical protein
VISQVGVRFSPPLGAQNRWRSGGTLKDTATTKKVRAAISFFAMSADALPVFSIGYS